GWRNCNSTSKSCAAFLAPASHRSQNGSVQLVTIAILGLVEPPRLHAGRQATPTPTAATRARRRNRDTAAPALGERIGQGANVVDTLPASRGGASGKRGECDRGPPRRAAPTGGVGRGGPPWRPAPGYFRQGGAGAGPGRR